VDDVEWNLPGSQYEAIAWVHNEHFTGSVAPLELSLRSLTVRMTADGLPNSLYINGYGYGRASEMRAAAGPQDESIVLGWRERRLPAVEDAAERLESFRPETVAAGEWRTALQANESLLWDPFRGVHADTMGQVFPASALWVRLYTERFGSERSTDGLALLAGFPNASTQRAVALWDLSRIAARDPALLAHLREGRLPAPDSDTARAFLADMQGMLSQYGSTTTMHLLDLPTWAEDPTTPLRMIVSMAEEADDHDPRLIEARAAARRGDLERELERLDTGDDAGITLLRQVYRVARHLAPASEDHNLLCDQRLIAAGRSCWLRIGAWLVARGVLPDSEAVFYLALDEAIAALEGQTTVTSATIAERRDLQRRWRAASPPATLGLQPDGEREPRLVRGVAASRGVHRGRARVIPSLPEAGHLEPGDVLVCPATSPEWTPYFGVIGALVTGSGSLLAHAAVVAREFGIPAVVGAAGAMQVIPDGAMVVVDGTLGVVTVEG
jgi:pyruvate,water dikinase